MTPLAEILVARIAATGPITIAEFMAECLLHPLHGYYTTKAPFGADGDFITAPEISQMFGELVGLALGQAWIEQGAPKTAILAEIGPGRGTLMQDVLRVLRTLPGGTAWRPHLVEASPRLRQEQARKVPDAIWLDTVADLPQAPLFLVANEFFDALPIRQFVRAPDGWSERMIGLTELALSFGLSQAAPIAALQDRLQDTTEGDLIETCAPALPIMEEIGSRIAQFGGAALIIDYGGWHSLGDTLQALNSHKPEPVLANPGVADLTGHVDFEPLARTADEVGAVAAPLTSQGVFLERLGITPRAQALARAMSPVQIETHIAAHRRLTHPEEMGNLFKVLGITPRGAAPIAGTAA
ncbi:MAG: SAM-dependent methyltransferase [Pseudomonadota bacterium]